MAHFMGGVQGNRGEATRLGSKSSGIDAWVKSWNARAVCSIRNIDDKDVISFDAETIGGNKKFIVELGNLSLDADEYFLLSNNEQIVKEILNKVKMLKELETPKE